MATSLSRMMKKAASSSINQLANKTPPRNYSSAVFTSPLRNRTSTTNINANLVGKVIRTTSMPSHHHYQFSSLAKKRSNSRDPYLNYVEYLIDCDEKKFHEVVPETPREFPFKIEDDPWDRYIRLTREYQGEKIAARVENIEFGGDSTDDDGGGCANGDGDGDVVEEAEERHENQEADQDEEKEEDPIVYLDITISKKERLELKFTGEVTADGIFAISYLCVQQNNASYVYPSYEVNKLSENMQKRIHKYLDVRGFGPGNTKILFDYMHKKYNAKNFY